MQENGRIQYVPVKATRINFIVKMDRERSEAGPRWTLKLECPFCGDIHVHDGGAGDRPRLGIKQAPCIGFGLYKLYVPDMRPAYKVPPARRKAPCASQLRVREHHRNVRGME